jgi:hypothetical protein
MKNVLSSGLILLVVLFVTPTAVSAQPAVYHCQASTQSGSHVTYYSSGPINGDQADSMQVNAAWNNSLQSTHPGLRGTCYQVNDSQSVEHKEGFWRSAGASVVRVDFTYAPSHAAALAQSAINPCAITTTHDLTTRQPGCNRVHVSYVVCYAGDASTTAYISATFKVTASSRAWNSAFARFLDQKYSYKGSGVSCADIDATDAQTYAIHRVGALRANGKTVVETGWAYASAPTLPVVIPAPVALATVAPAPSASAPTGLEYVICWADVKGLQPAAYFGIPFAAPTRENATWQKAYRTFLNGRYGRASAGGIMCNASKSMAVAQRVTQEWKDRYRSDSKVIETGWSYGSSSFAVTTGASSAPAPGNASYAACWAESPARRTGYLAVPFPLLPHPDIQAWTTQFRRFLTNHYGRVGPVNCRVLRSLSEAQRQMQTWTDEARARDKIVETGWKFH